MGAVAFLLVGIAYLAYKAKYLAMDGVEPWLQAFIVAPGTALLAAAGFFAFPDARRRMGACLLALGIVATLACGMEYRTSDGWTFYTPYSSLLDGSLRPSPALVGFATLTTGVGTATMLRLSLLGGLFFGLALWSLACFSPSGQLWVRRMEDMIAGMPNHDRYYYVSLGTLPGPHGIVDWLLPVVLVGAGAFVVVRARK